MSMKYLYLCDKDPRLFPNFCLDFLGLNNFYVENFFVNS